MLIRTRPGATVTDVDSPQIAILQSQTIVDAICHKDESDFVFEFVMHGRHWLIGHEDIEPINHQEVLVCQN